ncbi:hypothetical protein [Sphaerisporangium aureirubrum]|uniref:F0F1 ATP synthase subunit B n=1 Tax=Sphaerisporangium aureirubrum TaxID=1544736 RepID=A0ABW1NEE3_9ACTN
MDLAVLPWVVDLTTIPWVQGGALGLGLAMVLTTTGAVIKGLLIPRKQHDDLRKDLTAVIEAVRADAAQAVKDARDDRDARVAEANADAEEWRRLWEEERGAHNLSRDAFDEQLRGELRVAAEGTQLAVALLQTVHTRQTGAGP